MLELQPVLVEPSSQQEQDSKACEVSGNNGFEAKAVVNDLGACTAPRCMPFRLCQYEKHSAIHLWHRYFVFPQEYQRLDSQWYRTSSMLTQGRMCQEHALS